MLALDLVRSTRARVWIDERSPIAPCGADAELIGEVERGILVPEVSEVIVEVATNVGPFVHYGLIGASVTASPRGRVGLRVPYVRAPGPVIQTPLAGPPDEVTLALAEEFAEATMDALARAAAGRLSSCDLSIRYACCGQIGSSNDWMARLATAAIQIVAASARSSAPVISCLRAAFEAPA